MCGSEVYSAQNNYAVKGELEINYFKENIIRCETKVMYLSHVLIYFLDFEEPQS